MRFRSSSCAVINLAIRISRKCSLACSSFNRSSFSLLAAKRLVVISLKPKANLSISSSPHKSARISLFPVLMASAIRQSCRMGLIINREMRLEKKAPNRQNKKIARSATKTCLKIVLRICASVMPTRTKPIAPCSMGARIS